MRYKLQAYSLWEQGPRPKQEDALYPAHGAATAADRLFILCDGMGGHEAGEVASATVCRAMSDAVAARCPDADGAFTDDDFAAALAAAFDALDALSVPDAARKMGTTLAFLKLHASGATVAHIGDSRVYHIRPGRDAAATQILFRTEDHSLVNDLIRVGELTPEEAKTSHLRNVITRAMQPRMERRPRADVHHTADLRPGDCFLLCSDGILERMDDGNLRHIFSAQCGDVAAKTEILRQATAGNHDNHTAIIVHLLGVEDEDAVSAATATPSDVASPSTPPEATVAPEGAATHLVEAKIAPAVSEPTQHTESATPSESEAVVPPTVPSESRPVDVPATAVPSAAEEPADSAERSGWHKTLLILLALVLICIVGVYLFLRARTL